MALRDKNTERAVAILENHYTYRLWTKRPSRAALLACDTPSEFFAKLVFPDGLKPGEVPVWIDHTPINLDNFSLLRDAFPKARFISLVRDGRAVFSSVRKLEWGPTTPIQAASWWAARTAPGLAASLTYPELCMTVHYEDLVCGNPDNWTKLLRFVSEDDTRMVTIEDLAKQSGFDVPEFTKHQHALVGAAPSVTRAEAWRHDLSPREIELFEVNAGALLDTLGYDREYQFPRYASRGEMIRMGEWPVRITAQVLTRIRLARRWRKVKDPAKDASK
ncbi:Sulfotransferase family protein [Salipiger marinus]|uniref:Sulfotransferase family protein n=2 Tax=Salipiger marinus TaxID=555512 RepID=A0A1G8QKR5_9RHOB|nr:Sulfotransferase family protein [Salipiger marinus]